MPWRATSLRVINSNTLIHDKEPGRGRFHLRHHSADTVHHQGSYSSQSDSQPKDEQDASGTSKWPQWAEIHSQTEGNRRTVHCHNTVKLNSQGHSPYHNNSEAQILPSESCSNVNLSSNAEAAYPLHTDKRSHQLSTVCTQSSITSSGGPISCQLQRDLTKFTSSLTLASPRRSPEISHRGTTVIGTFDFHDREGTPSLLPCEEPLSSFSNCSLSGEQDGPTLLATFNFLGCSHPAPPMASCQAPVESQSSLTDSFTSLEDGKHLLAVFDFTKPGTERPPPPLALRPPPINTQRPGVTTAKKSDHPHAQGHASAASQKPTAVFPNKSVQSFRQKLTSSSIQKSSPVHLQSSTAATSQIFASAHTLKSVPAAPQKSASISLKNHAPAAPQKSALATIKQSGCPAKQSLSRPNLESQQARSSVQCDQSLPPTLHQPKPFTLTKQQISTTIQLDNPPLSVDSATKRECVDYKLDMEGSSGILYHINNREATPFDIKSKGQELSHEELPSGLYSKEGSEELTQNDGHFHSAELLCVEDEKRKEEEVNEENDHAVPSAPLSKQSSLDSISQFVSRQFADWDAFSPSLSLIQSGEFWCIDRPLSPVTGVSTYTPKGKISPLFIAPHIVTFRTLHPPLINSSYL